MKDKIYSGWAFDPYPEMTADEIAYHVDRLLELGVNFIWIGHNNPGECDAKKIEPALSYAVYEAFIDSSDPRHEDAIEIINAQRRLLDYCLKKNIPVVFPIGYQIQMGTRWNEAHPDSLRRFPNGSPIDLGGISACFYAPQYQRDIKRFYKWVADTIIKDYRSIIIMVNLADEPFGGDYSEFAEKAFKEKNGMTFQEALNGDDTAKRALGEFQNHYIADYAAWSAIAWHDVCPDIPSTMSFCGFHAREENLLPSVPALFAKTPPYFHPSFDVYPRDGDQKTPISEEDIVMLVLLLKQLAYLSSKHKRPYWLWTTGNSWGLGQGSLDQANITDAVVNQIMAVSSASEYGAKLAGFAIWNYNIKYQGLYNDAYKTIYDTEDMLVKLTRVIAALRELPDFSKYIDARIAIVADKEYAHQFIAENKLLTSARAFPFHRFAEAAKYTWGIFIDESLSDMMDYFKKEKITPPQKVLYLSTGAAGLSEKEQRAIQNHLSGNLSNVIVMPKRFLNKINKKKNNPQNIIPYACLPTNLPREVFSICISNLFDIIDGMFHIFLEDMEIVYNISGIPARLELEEFQEYSILTYLDAYANVVCQYELEETEEEYLIFDHHEAVIFSDSDSDLILKLTQALEKKNMYE